jgi:Kef-type K+ transport system membrane component KefB
VPDVSFTGIFVVAAVAFTAPLALGLAPGLRIPAVVLELVGGIVVGPSALGWVEPDAALELLSLLGLAFLLLLAGLEIDFDRLRGRLLGITAVAFAFSLALALAAGAALDLAGLITSPLLVAIMLAATSLGVVVPVLRDSGRGPSPVGQLVIAGASIADIASIVLLSLFFSGESSDVGAQLVLLGAFGALVVLLALALTGIEHWMRLGKALVRLQDTTAQIRVRGVFVLLALFVAFAEGFGLEAILGAFAAGAVINLIDRDRAMTHPQFRQKLESASFGIFVPFFFVTSGVKFDLDALLSGGSSLAKVPVFLAALLLVRGVPALLYRRLIGLREAAAAGLLQATSLGSFVVAGQIGMELGLLGPATGAALVSAGLASVLLFPAVALLLLSGASRSETPRAAPVPRPQESRPA